ncbi:MAG TPA: rod shape-determining protein MreC [Candidatus Limnocylindria bacterium]|nr:rod shape-determining protein MreC [Candidatus Limnocylindria bacterium]
MRFIYTKAFAIFFSLLVLLTILVFFQTKGWLDPIKMALLESPRPVVSLVGNIAKPIKRFFTTIYSLKNISEENTRLNAKVSNLEQNLVLYQEEARENETLRKDLGFVQTSKDLLKPCTVLSQNPFGLSNALVLNCGSKDGIIEGQAVISEGYLVGKIVYVSPDSSTVLLAISSNFSTDARVSQTNDTAIVKGSFGSGLILDQVAQVSSLDKGSIIVTAGINEKIPKNILIGEVSNILSSNNDLFKQAAISSPIDFSNLNFVFVVK